MNNFPACVDCEHVVICPLIKTYKCKLTQTTERDIITGETRVSSHSCEMERYYGYCGVSGKYFTPKKVKD